MSRAAVIGSPVPPTAPAASPEPLWSIDRDETAQVVFITRAHGAAPRVADWQSRMTRAMRRLGAMVIGAKRVDAAGQIFSMGEMVIHPKGFHHLAKGAPGTAYRFPEEVDALAGGVLAVDTHAFDAVEGATLCQGVMGPIVLCLALRQRGGRCIVVPDVVIEDDKGIAPTAEDDRAFRDRFGFDWRAADLDEVADKHAGSPLLWNARFFGNALPFEKYDQRPAMHWTSYQQVQVYRQRADHLINMISQLCPKNQPALDLGCGDGLFSHLAALQGLAVTGVDLEQAGIDQAKAQTATQTYPGQAPRFQLTEPGPLPFDDDQFQLVFMLDVIEHLPNPIAVLREAARVIRPGGCLLVTTPAWQLGTWSDATYHLAEYTPEELARQLNATAPQRGLRVAHAGSIGGVYRDIVMVAQRGN